MTMTVCPSCRRCTFAYSPECEVCGKPLEGARPLIGAGCGPLEDIVCRHCRYVNDPDVEVCADCGNPLEGGDFPSCEEPEVFAQSVMHTVYSDKREEVRGESCIVTLEDDQITVSYDDEDEEDGSPINYKFRGKDHGDGHYELRFKFTDKHGNRGEGHATLHRITPESQMLEGFWKEIWGHDEYRGAWQVVLRK